MNERAEECALRYLNEDYLLNMGMIQVICRGTAEIYEAGETGVFLCDSVSNAYMVSTDDMEQGRCWLREREREGYELMQVCQKPLADFARVRYGFQTVLDCAQAVYTKKEPIPYDFTLKFREPDEEEMKRIRNVYQKLSDEELYQIRSLHHLYVGLSGGRMVGFIGSHLEGSIGLLEVLTEHRGQGYGTELEIYMVNRFLEWGYIPYGQVEAGNEKSECLQKKLGMEFSKGRVYWLF